MPEGEGQGPDLWSQILAFLQQIVVPDWSGLVALLPLGVLALVVLVLALNAYRWWSAAAINRSRVPARITAGAPPPGVHLPGPSRWPLLVPIGATFLGFALVFAQGGIPNPTLLGIGLLLTAVALGGWLRDAGREWRTTEVGAHGHTGETLLHGGPGGPAALPAPTVPLEPPPGVHLPGPSPWPLFAPVAMTFLFFGLVFGPVLIVAGLVMGVIAAVGWYRDANLELRQVETGGHTEPRTRDPERAFPKRLAALYVLIGALSVAIVATPAVVSMARSAFGSGSGAGAGGGAGGPGASPSAGPLSPQVAVSADQLRFDVAEIRVPAGQQLTITFTNKEAAPHNVSIYDSSARTNTFLKGDLLRAAGTITYSVPPLDAGQYYFQCDVHPDMNGTVNAQ